MRQYFLKIKNHYLRGCFGAPGSTRRSINNSCSRRSQGNLANDKLQTEIKPQNEHDSNCFDTNQYLEQQMKNYQQQQDFAVQIQQPNNVIKIQEHFVFI